MGRQIRAVATSPFAQQNGRIFINKERCDDLQYLTELIDAGKITPIIDRTYPLSQTPEAIRYLEGGHARGKIVITA
jgi:NADPH:quinone reductase-like Zn-dependent oxidoreductase